MEGKTAAENFIGWIIPKNFSTSTIMPPRAMQVLFPLERRHLAVA